MKPTFFKIALPLLLLPGISISGVASQSDWSGGNGVPGPVTQWTDSFLSDSCVVWGDSLALCQLLENVVTTDSPPIVACPADIDSDGDIDIVEIVSTNGGILWWSNLDGTGTSWASYPVTTYSQHLTCACISDFDGDGDMDVAAGSPQSHDVLWWEQPDTGIWIMHTIDNNFDDPSCLFPADIDSDGDIDLAGASGIVWWENLVGSGTLWEKHVLLQETNYEATSVAVADLNGDGFPDIVGASNWGEVDCWINLDGYGTAWQKHLVADMGISTVWTDLNDADGDSDVDIFAAIDGDCVMWFENVTGEGSSWSEHYIDQNFPGAFSATSADYDSDGFMDVFCSGESAGFCLWTGDGGSNWEKHVIANLPAPTFAVSTGSGDINGDGQEDAVGSYLAVGEDRYIKWWSISPDESAGTLVSSILDVEEFPDWQLIDWSSTEPPGTSVSFQVRSSSDPQTMGSWSDTLFSPCSLVPYLSEGGRYFQYKAILRSTDPGETPVLHDVSVVWFPGQGTGGSGGSSTVTLSGAFPNPSSGLTSICYELSECCFVEVFVHDITGRVVTASASVRERGEHSVQLDDLCPGLYLIRLKAGDQTITRSFVVIE